MPSGEEMASDYRTTLSELTCNNKTQINMLTILAEDYKDYSSFIVEVLESELLSSSPQRKIVILYVIDSIVKNIPKEGDYRAHFSKNIVKIFEHVFQKSEEKTRAQLHKLRQTWTDIFPRGKLYDIDQKVNAIDQAWPIASATVVPKARRNGVIPTVTVKAPPPINQTVHLNPKFLNQNNEKAPRSQPQPPSKPTKRVMIKPEAIKTELSENVEVAPKPALKKPKYESVETASGPPLKNHSTNSIPNNHNGHFNGSHNNNKDRVRKSPPHGMQPTVALGSHAFITPQVLPQPIINNRLQPTLSVQNNPGFTATSISCSGQISGGSSLSGAVAATVVPTMIHMPAVTSGLSMQGSIMHSPQIPMMMPPMQQASAPTICNDTPRIGMPANNRVFVDGKAYDVHFLHDVPVIIRNGLPHRVSFCGPPRDVIIDGIVHRLAFNESKAVIIDGESHVLRFGAPSRELYMGNFPFKGVFGGAPIIATINGRRHEIRLTGTPPEAKIEQDPSYELARYMESIPQTGSVPLLKPEPPKKDTAVEDVSSLLKKLQHSGIIQSLLGNKPAPKPIPPSSGPSTSGDYRNASSPPIPSAQRLDNIERRAAPMSSLDQFSMRSLVIRYDSVIDELHKPRACCQYCGIATRELYGEAYQQHNAWHLKEIESELKGDKYTRSRPWFMSEDWFTYSETELANRITATDNEKDTDDQIASGSGTDSGDALSSLVDEKDCCVCNEKFEEYFDEDDDAWKLRDCVFEEGKAFHRYCKADVSFTNRTSNIVSDFTCLDNNFGYNELMNKDKTQNSFFSTLCNVNDISEVKNAFH